MGHWTISLGMCALAWFSSCRKEVPSSGANQVIFRDARGRELTAKDLAGVTGQVDWSIQGAEHVSQRAIELHDLGRRAGAAGDNDRALLLFDQAQKEAPNWPYPAYDSAYTFLLKGNIDQAERKYAVVERLSPRGFFTAKTEMDCIRRERKAEIAPGTCRMYVIAADMDDPTEKRAVLEELLRQSPSLPGAWQKLAALLNDDDARMAAIDKGLSFQPDGDCRGVLLIDKALILARREKRTEAIRILGELALDPESTLATEQMAKLALATLSKQE
jgi:tetratricopeptide (TPR) repeat protein